MVKINLLPGYIFEKGRILLTVVVFVVLLGVEGGVLYMAKMDIEKIEVQYKEDTPKFAGEMAKIKTAEDAATEWQGKAGTYTELIDFFTGKSVQPHNAQLRKVLALAPSKFRTPGEGNIWFSEMSFAGKTVTAKGHIKGLSNYVNYFFAMRDKNVTVTTSAPKVMPTATAPQRPPTYAQEFDVEVSTDIGEELPATAPAGPTEAKSWEDLYTFGGASGAADAGAAGGTPAPAPGAAPAN